MQELSNFHAPGGASLTLSRDPVSAVDLRMRPSFALSKIKVGGPAISPWSPSSGVYACNEGPATGNGSGWNSCEGGQWAAGPQRVPSQSSVLRLSQSMRWSKGGVIVESHVASTRVISAAPQPAEGCDWNGLFESPFQEGQRGMSYGQVRPSASWDSTQLASNGPSVLPLVAPSSASNVPIVLARRTEPEMQSLQFVRKLEVLQGATTDTRQLQSRGSSSSSSTTGFSAVRQGRLEPLQGPSLYAITKDGEFDASHGGPGSAARPQALPANVVVPRQQDDPLDGFVAAERKFEGDHLRRPRVALKASSPIPRILDNSCKSGGHDGAGSLGLGNPNNVRDRRQVVGAPTRRRSSGQPVDLSSIRTVKGPLYRTQSLEPGTRAQRANKVAVRHRSKEEVSPAEARLPASGVGSSSPFQHSAADEAGSINSVQTIMQSDWASSEGRSRDRRSPSFNTESQGRVSQPTWPPQGRRHMSTTEAYFGRVPGASADFQRLLSFQGQEAQRSTKAWDAGAANEKSINGSHAAGLNQQNSAKSGGKFAQGFRGGVAGTPPQTEAPVTKEPARKEHDGRKGKAQRSSTKARSSPLEYTEAATAVKAMAAAEASAAAAAAARAANAGPVPTWQSQQVAAAKEDQTRSQRRSSTLRKSLSLPISVLAKVKAKLTRSKSDA